MTRLLVVVAWLSVPSLAWAAPAPQLSTLLNQPLISTTPQTITVAGSRLVAGFTATIGEGAQAVLVPLSNVSLSARPQTFKFTYTFTAGNVVIRVKNPDGKVSNGLTISVVSNTPPMPLTLTCPANISTTTTTTSAVVGYAVATTTGGTAPVLLTYVLPSGSTFPLGPTQVVVTARDAAGQVATCGFSVTVTAVSTSVSGVGPQASITCPSPSIAVPAGGDLQAAVTANPAGTTFCLGAGVTTIRGSITPKSGDTFVGQFGAILDGTGWLTTDTTMGAFRAWNQDIDDVTIRNLTIRNVPMGGVTAFRDSSDRWTVDHVEIGPCGGTGINLPHSGNARWVSVHDCKLGGYAAYLSNNTRWEDSEYARNGNESKISLTSGTVMLRNFVHDSINCLWLDGENIDWLLDSNRCEDNAGNGVYIEVSGRGIARNNQIRRNGENGIVASLSHDVQIVGNVLENNAHGIVYFVDCSRVGSAEGNYQYPGHVPVPFTMGNISATGNTITVGTQAGAFANGFSYTSCTQTQLDAYLNGSMGLTFAGNSYQVPSVTGAYWLWNGMKTWAQWQAIPQDGTGTVR